MLLCYTVNPVMIIV